jgi:hypothetical protein
LALTILSGIAPTTRGGTGRLLRSLVAERQAKDLNVRFVLVGNRANVARSMVAREPLKLLVEAGRHYARRASRHWLIHQPSFVGSPRLVVFHPQEIGTRWLARVIAVRTARNLKTEIFVLDESFFCIRSYNHLPGEDAACLRCLEQGPEPALRFGCQTFPIRDRWAAAFIHQLQRQALAGEVVFWTQTTGQVSLLRRWAGEAVNARSMGLWTDDFDELQATPAEAAPLADVVYHGAWLAAKGGPWALRLAELMPERRFLFPCRRPPGITPPPNVIFRQMSWDSGLAAQVRSTPLSLVPSLWTAPIEASLVKSIAHAPATAVIPVPGSFAESLPADVALKLPSAPSEAAAVIRRHASWRIDPGVRQEWIQTFTARNRGLLQRLCDASPA